jgi:hypothetical protein
MNKERKRVKAAEEEDDVKIKASRSVDHKATCTLSVSSVSLQLLLAENVKEQQTLTTDTSNVSFLLSVCLLSSCHPFECIDNGITTNEKQNLLNHW